MDDGWVLFGLILLAVPFVLPIVSLVRSSRTNARLRDLGKALADQQQTIDKLTRHIAELRRPVPAAAPTAPAQPVVPPPIAPPQAPVVSAPQVSTPPKPTPAVPPPISAPSAGFEPPFAFTMPSFNMPAFDWENLIGVKLFSGIAGVALVIAAIFFLRYSIEHGWLQPPVRVAIGILVSTTLLVVCERKAARKYRVTANALDGAAIAILFATFFAASALWHLIPASAAFALMALVTAVAVLLSIRRDSLFIAVLGLLGGFATPALLSTGENQPIPLFAYLLLLNIGLAWVAYRKRWPALSTLTVVLTAVYQWGWVFRFLNASQLPLAAGIFLLFPLVTVVGLALARRQPIGPDADIAELTFERTGLVASALPLLFSAYLSAVPAYGQHTGILFGLLLIVDAGLFAVSLARTEELLHGVGAVGTLAVFASWLSNSYAGGSYTTVLYLLPIFVAFFAFAPTLAARLNRPFRGDARHTIYTAALLLVAFPVFANSAAASRSPLPLFAVLFTLLALLAWRALVERAGSLYFVAAFFSVIAQAVWSSGNLSADRLPTAILMYGVFGVLSIGVPLIARRLFRPLTPPWGGGAVLITSLLLLLFLAAGPISPSALWGLALLIAILDAGLFVEAASGRLPLMSAAGGLLSWFVLAIWLTRSATAVGLLPSLLVIVLLTLVMLAGYAWSYAQVESREVGPSGVLEGFRTGLYLGLGGHLFLIGIAMQRIWAVPPWPLFGALAVITLAVSLTALYARMHALHAAGVVAAMVLMLFWSDIATARPWPTIALVAAESLVAFALLWIRIAGRFKASRIPRIGAAVALFLFEAVAIIAASKAGAPSIGVLIVAHMLNLAVLLLLTWRAQWNYVAPAAVIPAALALVDWQRVHPQPDTWWQLVALGGGIYAVFMAYPFVLGARSRDNRDPHFAAVLASGVFFFAARQAFQLGGLGWMVGTIPVFEGAMLALLLRLLLRIQRPGTRDLGRLALVAGASLAFVTAAIPLQLQHQWITIGWALEGGALAWLYRRIPHRGLLYAAAGLLAVVFVRLAMNPEIFHYQPRGSLRILNWYLYTYVVCAAAFFAAGWLLSSTNDRLGPRQWRVSQIVPAAGVILLFVVLNIEIADFYATGSEIMFRFGAGLAQDLTYTIGWLAFGIALLTASIYLKRHAGRIAAVALIAVTTFKCFLYDLSSLGGLYRIGSFVGLAMTLTLVSLALQKYVLRAPKEI